MNQSFPGTMQSRVLTHSTNVCIFVSHCCRSNLNTGACSYYCSCAVYCRWTWFITGSSDCHGVRMRSELKKTSTVRPWKFIFMAICKGVCEGASTKKKKRRRRAVILIWYNVILFSTLLKLFLSTLTTVTCCKHCWKTGEEKWTVWWCVFEKSHYKYPKYLEWKYRSAVPPYWMFELVL